MLKPPDYVPISELDERIFVATVPADHYLRRVKEAIDFDGCRELMASAYDRDQGRPAVEPVLLLKLEFLQYQYNFSDRQVVDQAHYNMAFRYFLGLSLESELPHHTLLTYFRERLGTEKHQQVFDAIVAQARARGLVKDRLRLKDATHVIANIAIPSTIRLVAQTRQQLLAALRPVAAERVAKEEQHAAEVRAATADLSGQERLLQRVTHLRAIVAWAEAVPTDAAFATMRAAQQERLREVLQVAHKVLADRDDSEGADHLVSIHDPDARQGKHVTYYVGYLLDAAMDADSQIVTALNVLPQHGAEAMDAVTLLRQEEQTHGNDVQALSVDKAGFHGPALRALTDPQGLAVDVYVPPRDKPARAYFKAEDFTLDSTGDTLTCPGGQTTQKRRRGYGNTGWSFRFARSACAACPLQAQCLPALPQTTGRVVFKTDYEKEYQEARAKVGSAAYAAVRREHRAVMERKLAEMVRWHGGRRARYRGRFRVLLQELLTGIVVNVKRMVSLINDPQCTSGGTVRAHLALTG